MTARHGLVIGKFYPPHAGHHLLIDVAAAGSERLTVLVCDQGVESIPGPLRTRWVADAHRHQPHVSVVHAPDDNPVDFDDPAVWDRHMKAFDQAIGRSNHAEEPVDAVFSSEPYGDELARRLGATPVCVDLARTEVAVSGTAVRDDPVGHWHLIDAQARAWFARRVAVVGDGAEEVAAAVAARLRARGGPWAADGGGPVVVCVGDHGSGVAHCAISRSATPEEKVAEAEAFVEEVVARGWQLAAPLG